MPALPEDAAPGSEGHVRGLSTLLGQRTSLTANVPTQGFTNALTKYYYDPLYQLTKVDYPAASPFGSEVDSWTYDAIGNRLTNTVNGTPRTYTYFKNGANPLNGQRLSNDGTNAYTWDPNGSNLTRNGAPGNFTFGYSADNRLSSISGAATAVYTYDYQGRRTSKTVSGQATTYLYDGLNLVGETTGGTLTNYAFGPGIDEPLIVNRGGTISYFNADGLGSVTGTNSAAGTYDYNSIFDAWGSVRSETGTRTNSFTYTGREKAEAGLHFYRARFLQPGVGRFGQEDPLGTEVALAASGLDSLGTSYHYVENRPITSTDPTGLLTYQFGRSCRGLSAGDSQKLGQAVTEAMALLPGINKCGGLAASNQTVIVRCLPAGHKDCGLGRPPIGPLRGSIWINVTQALRPGGCGQGTGCLESTVLHELVHTCGGNEDDSYACEKKYFGATCNLGPYVCPTGTCP